MHAVCWFKRGTFKEVDLNFEKAASRVVFTILRSESTRLIMSALSER